MKATEARSRVQFKNILFATDFSSAASAAVLFAAELTKRWLMRWNRMRAWAKQPFKEKAERSRVEEDSHESKGCNDEDGCELQS